METSDGHINGAPAVEDASQLSLMRRSCWVCFATEEEDPGSPWVQPCRCRGTTKWVHQACLQRWVDEKQKTGQGRVACPQCQTEYIIVYPDMGILVLLLDTADGLIFKGSLFFAAGVAAGAVYWTGVTYGAITVMQVIGQKEGIDIMEQADPLVLLLGLPSIPIALILGRLISWEDALLNFLRKHCPKFPVIFKAILPQFGPEASESGSTTSNNNNNNNSNNVNLPPISNPVSATRILCGALVMPTVANFFGKLLFSSIKSNFQRTLCGGLTFIVIKGFLRIYHKQQQYIRQCQRRILDYTDTNIATHLNLIRTPT